jgi:UDP-GlcNAc:undecaprenyl-phosphate GlcNAc-1-phosphate transferase
LVANWYQGDFHLQALIMALVIFLLFNLATGRIFLGDFGSYGLSSLVAFLALDLYARGDFTLWFLGAMLAYPCVEMMRVVTSRLARHESPFSAGNDHMHNYAYECLVQRGMQNITANSLTGIGIALISAGMPAFLVTSGAVPTPSTDFWFAYFIAYLVVHVFVAQWLQRCVEEK